MRFLHCTFLFSVQIAGWYLRSCFRFEPGYKQATPDLAVTFAAFLVAVMTGHCADAGDHLRLPRKLGQADSHTELTPLDPQIGDFQVPEAQVSLSAYH